MAEAPENVDFAESAQQNLTEMIQASESVLWFIKEPLLELSVAGISAWALMVSLFFVVAIFLALRRFCLALAEHFRVESGKSGVSHSLSFADVVYKVFALRSLRARVVAAILAVSLAALWSAFASVKAIELLGSLNHALIFVALTLRAATWVKWFLPHALVAFKKAQEYNAGILSELVQKALYIAAALYTLVLLRINISELYAVEGTMFEGAPYIMATILVPALFRSWSGLKLIRTPIGRFRDNVEIGRGKRGRYITSTSTHTVIKPAGQRRIMVPNAEVVANPVINHSAQDEIPISEQYHLDISAGGNSLVEVVAEVSAMIAAHPLTSDANAPRVRLGSEVRGSHVLLVDYLVAKTIENRNAHQATIRAKILDILNGRSLHLFKVAHL